MHIEEVNYNDILAIRKEAFGQEFLGVSNNAEADKNAIHLGIIDGNEVMGVFSIYLDGMKLQFSPIAIRKQVRGKGYGTAILQWLKSYDNDMKFDSVWSMVPQESIEFYKVRGFEPISSEGSQNMKDENNNEWVRVARKK